MGGSLPAPAVELVVLCAFQFISRIVQPIRVPVPHCTWKGVSWPAFTLPLIFLKTLDMTSQVR